MKNTNTNPIKNEIRNIFLDAFEENFLENSNSKKDLQELSLDELESISAGFSFNSILNPIKKGLNTILDGVKSCWNSTVGGLVKDVISEFLPPHMMGTL